jgi:hypothetical protein
MKERRREGKIWRARNSRSSVVTDYKL